MKKKVALKLPKLAEVEEKRKLEGRKLFMPKYPELPEACPSCPFRDGNNKEWAAKCKQLAEASGEENAVNPAMSRNRIKADMANAVSGDFICHGTAYTQEMERRPMSEARQCPGATAYYKSGKKAPMDSFYAVFNNHVNNAHSRAKNLFKEMFGAEVWKLSGLAAMEKTGIMAIFDRPPNKHTQFYVDKVTEYVNEGRT